MQLKHLQPVTAKELGTRFGVSANAVRRHLKELQADGLVVHGRVQRGMGAPTFAYRLSEAGEVLFPKRYEETLTELLEHVSETAGRATAVGMFEQRYAELTRKLQADLAVAPAERRLEVVARVMSDAGYMAEWEGEAGTFKLSEHNCAIRAVAERYPEVCAAEEQFLQDVLAAEVERRAHIASGCHACEYAITFGAPVRPAGPGPEGAPQERG